MSDRAFEDFEKRAEAGDADAQYALAAICAQRGLADLAQRWLHRAGEQGHADALFTLAGAILTRTEGAAEHRAEAIAGLDKARARGSLAALRTLAALTAAGLIDERGWPAALEMMREACDRGDAAAKREIAALLLEVAAGDADGAALLVEAARTDPLASALAARRKHRGMATSPGAVSLDRAFDRILTAEGGGAREEISAAPRIGAFRAAVGPDLCDHLMGTALPRLKRQEIIDPVDNKPRPHPHRTAWGAAIGFGFADLPAVFAGQRMARLAGVPYEQGEALSILRYRPGEEYRPHHDFLGAGDPDLPAHGQRIRTALLYLNEGYIGGETHFLAPDVAFAGRTGDILVFDNVNENGEPDVSARHAGKPILRGEKWLGSLWLRDRPFAG